MTDTQDISLKAILEGALLAAGEPMNLARMQTLFVEEGVPEKETLIEALNEIQSDFEGRGFALVEVSSGWRFQVREELAPWVNRLWEEKPQKYSRALLETLALIAYRQPLTRGDIEEVRGVAVSSHIIKTLSEREWVKVVGHRDVPGRPALYATTKTFLDYFNLKSLDELPTLGELKDIESLDGDLELEALLQTGEKGADPVPTESANDENSDALEPSAQVVALDMASDADNEVSDVDDEASDPENETSDWEQQSDSDAEDAEIPRNE